MSPATDPRTPLHDPEARGFASDNYAGVHPEVLEAIAAANGGHQVSYGDGRLHRAAAGPVPRSTSASGASAFPVFNGTGANVVSLQAMTDRWEAVICAETAHINVDECGAPERVGGLKLLTVPTPDGKLTPELIDLQAWGFGDEHRAQPQVVSITQTTELGTCYTVDEIAAIAEHAHERGMVVHLDGARIANAAATLGVPLRAFTTDVGVDVLSFGGTKNGLMLGEVHRGAQPESAVRGRGLPAQVVDAAGVEDALRLGPVRRAARPATCGCATPRHANAMARRLEAAVRDIPGVDDPAAGAGQRGLRGHARRRSPSGCRSGSGSTSGTSRPARCAG